MMLPQIKVKPSQTATNKPLMVLDKVRQEWVLLPPPKNAVQAHAPELDTSWNEPVRPSVFAKLFDHWLEQRTLKKQIQLVKAEQTTYTHNTGLKDRAWIAEAMKAAPFPIALVCTLGFLGWQFLTLAQAHPGLGGSPPPPDIPHLNSGGGMGSSTCWGMDGKDIAAPGEARAEDKGGGWVTYGLVNNQKARFVVDTGASTVVLSSGLARAASIQAESYVSVGTAGGASTAAVVTIPKLQVGGIVMHNVQAMVMDSLPNGDSLLGKTFLDRVDMEKKRGQMVFKTRTG